ncbi:MAG: NrsF family protein [Gemmobacter sp.]
MKTHDLIGLLATGAGPVEPPRDGRLMLIGLPVAFVVAVVAVTLSMGLVPPALWGASSTATKLAYAGLVTGAGIWLLRCAGRPGMSVAGPLILLAALLGVVAATGMMDLLMAQPEARMSRLIGYSSITCPWAVMVLSLPALAATMAAVRLLAPVRLRLAGAAAGLAAGGVAAGAYALGCTEGAYVFIAVWYSLGLALATGLGALIGPQVLRW